jgi:hypothetical protein
MEQAFCSSQGRDTVELFIEREKCIVFANLKRGMLILCSFEVREGSEMFIRLSERWCFFCSFLKRGMPIFLSLEGRNASAQFI